jgi:glucose/arabinose dehydrogenase
MKLPRFLTRTILFFAILLLVLALLPADITPQKALKSLADLIVRDHDFEPLTITFYNRLRPILFLVSLFAMGILWALTRENSPQKKVVTSMMRVGIVVGAIFVILIGFNLARLKLNSPVYRYLSGTSVAFVPPAATPQPSPTAIPSPTPTLALLQPGTWELVASDFEKPVVVTNAPDGSGRIFVGSKFGYIRIVQNDELKAEPFLNIQDRVLQEVDSHSTEQGFLGLAFHPNYRENGYFYVNYINKDENTVISRFTVSADDSNRADPYSEYFILGIHQPAWDHKGGQLAFGPDGYLYIGVGDGGIARDPRENAQSLDVPLGKILRIDVDQGRPYGIPADNPFWGKYGLDEIFALGLRNPWQFSFDALTGDVYIGDVGHKLFDEVDFIPAGELQAKNFGWNHYEGVDLYTSYDEDVPAPVLDDHTPPIWSYSHSGKHCAVIGGYVYRGEAIPSLQGIYVYGDYCSGVVWGLKKNAQGVWENQALFETGWVISAFGVDESNELYLIDFRDMDLYKLVSK